jgi:ADP-heptose:LPS heptosyltransferase
MAAWAATALRERHPDAFLCWAVESRCAPMLDRTRLVSRVEEIPRQRWKRTRWSPATWGEQIAKYARLRRLRFDVGFDLQGYSKTALCLRLAAPKRRVAIGTKDPVAQRLNPSIGIRPPGVHTIEWYGEALRSVGDYVIPQRPIMPHDPDAARSLSESIGGDQPLATITVSAGHENKAYYAQGWVEVAEGLMARGYRVALLGGPTDTPILLPGTVDLVGKLALGSTLEAVRLSTVHVSADTGNGHMAAAVGVPTVSVFGPTDPSAFRPYTDQGVVLRNGDRPDAVTPTEILQAVRDLVGR